MNNTELREALELAALAAGLDVLYQGFYRSDDGTAVEMAFHRGKLWAPHTDDGDSRRLQVALGIGLSPTINHKEWTADHFCSSGQWIKVQDADPKRAILRVAAEIGRRMRAERERAK